MCELLLLGIAGTDALKSVIESQYDLFNLIYPSIFYAVYKKTIFHKPKFQFFATSFSK